MQSHAAAAGDAEANQSAAAADKFTDANTEWRATQLRAVVF
jgi:hypothetical protein